MQRASVRVRRNHPNDDPQEGAEAHEAVARRRFLATVALGLSATQPALGLGDLHTLAGTKPDEVGLDPATIASTLNNSRPTASVGS